MIFKQLIESDSSTYTYLLACERTRLALLIDPVLDTVERDLQVVADLGLKLAATLDPVARENFLGELLVLFGNLPHEVGGAVTLALAQHRTRD